MIGRWALALLTALSAIGTAQAQGTDPVPRCGGHFQTCGYADKASGTLLIPEKFEVAHPFKTRIRVAYDYSEKQQLHDGI